MAEDHTASIIPLHQCPRPAAKAPMTPAQRAKAYRERKRQKTEAAPAERKAAPVPAVTAPEPAPAEPVAVTAPEAEPVTPAVTSRVTPSRESIATIANGETSERPPRRPVASIALVVASFALAGVGITMNGWFARSLGSSEIAGWLFLAIGVAADLVALAAPSCAASLWQAHQRGTALAGWAIWAMTFAFAVNAGIGFASVNITDVTAARASRVTPAVTTAQAALSDAMASRDRECAGGVGKNCRQREETVNERRHALDLAMRGVQEAADPQIEAATRIVAWLSGGVIKPSADDFAMLRLVLLALLPQVGGILLMVGRGTR
ncbi:hypothetical protein [Bradyrhizobium paxllaeri]|uniref:hypothetical protein n=1 Tax=Bradyrhizobium paxllaeri TaxID=190148 RepID=UPI00081078E8|nr:hypothetical protein [Bradyrhizobium paxllaeri]